MHRWLRDLALCFAAGATGGAAKGALVWVLGHFPATASLGGFLAGALYPQNLPYANGVYARVVWGGLCAFLFLLPVARNASWLAGLLWALALTLVQWIVLPLLHGGLHFSPLVLATLILNGVWGLTTALMLRWIR